MRINLAVDRERVRGGVAVRRRLREFRDEDRQGRRLRLVPELVLNRPGDRVQPTRAHRGHFAAGLPVGQPR